MWVYKHDLFQRDRPELLHLVRRRTCPGNDKRKQRLSRPPKESPTGKDIDNSDEEDASFAGPETGVSTEHEMVTTEEPVVVSSRKRTMLVSDFDKPRSTKRPTLESCPAVVVDATMLHSLSSAAVSVDSDDQASAMTKLDDAEQSAIVSDVASKLAKYARMAKKGTRGGRGRRTGSGMVTPPDFKTSSGNLLTYDDECIEDETPNSNRSSGVRSVVSPNIATSVEDSPQAKKATTLPEAVPFDVAQAIIKSIVDSSKDHPDHDSLVSAANVSSFCMAVTPAIAAGKNLLCRKILDLFHQSEPLAQEFVHYRSALYPVQKDDLAAEFMSAGERASHTALERTESRSDALREFTVFAVNRIFEVMDFGCETGALSSDATALLERTAAVWQKTVWSME